MIRPIASLNEGKIGYPLDEHIKHKLRNISLLEGGSNVNKRLWPWSNCGEMSLKVIHQGLIKHCVEIRVRDIRSSCGRPRLSQKSRYLFRKSCIML